ncbi:MAG: hypothetical protein EBZ13_05930 [Planctomycetia bacterium]|nr:hypothetical protein [Planctomycetia bacterium]
MPAPPGAEAVPRGTAAAAMVWCLILKICSGNPTFKALTTMSKPHRTLKKANHGSRPANSKARKAKRKHIKT